MRILMTVMREMMKGSLVMKTDSRHLLKNPLVFAALLLLG